MQTPDKRIVKVLAKVGCQDDDAVIFLHTLEQITDLDVGVTVVAIFHLRALTEQRVGLIEEENRVARAAFSKYLLQVLLGFAYIFANNACQVYFVKLKAQVGGQ